MTTEWDRPRPRGRFGCSFAYALTCVAFAGVVHFSLVSAVRPAAAPAAERLSIAVPAVASDPSVKLDYDLVYVRAPRGDEKYKVFWANTEPPTVNPPGAELMLLHPDGKEEVLAPVAAGESIGDPAVSFDGQWVLFAKYYEAGNHNPHKGSDIFKVHVPTRRVVQLTHQEHTPNAGGFDPKRGDKVPEAVYNLDPCPLPGGRVAFVSNRDAVKTPQGYPVYALQLFVMDDNDSPDDAERNVDKIGHLNVAGALHPVILKDGRIIFSSLESQGIRGGIQWGIWAIRPDGSHSEPVVSAFLGGGASDAWHFQTQQSDGHIVAELYYNQNTSGFGAHFRLPLPPADGTPRFLPADPRANPDPDKMFLLGGPIGGTGPRLFSFQPVGMESITRFGTGSDQTTLPADPKDKNSPRTGKVAHPCGAPDNHLLTVYTPGAGPSGGGPQGGPQTDAGIYLIKDGRPIDEPGRMLLVKNDPNFNEQWPRPLVPYKRVYGVDEPARLDAVANDGKLNPELPAGTPFGLVGSASLYKRETFPRGKVPAGSVTATGNPYAAFGMNSWLGPGWQDQGTDAGLYTNDEVHAIRILAMEPATSAVAGRFYNRANERLRILGEVPVRKFDKAGNQPTDPDGNPDTSFLVKIPADIAFTFQTLDKDGMVLNMAQTWHQVRPGEVRNDCGGCHAHSQRPTDFSKTATAGADYKVFDLTKQTPLLSAKAADQSHQRWDAADDAGLRYQSGPKDVEYFRDVRPILQRSCVACHSHAMQKPPGGLVLDPEADLHESKTFNERFNTVHHQKAMSGLKSVKGRVPFMIDPRYVWNFRSRQSLIVWKVHGRRTDGLALAPVKGYDEDRKKLTAVDYDDKPMPPAEAVAGTFEGPDGSTVKVPPLTDEDKRTIVRWIDLGCPIDWDFDPAKPTERGRGWMLDDQRPTLAVTLPRAGANATPVDRILVGMFDYGTGIAKGTFSVTADFEVGGVKAGEELAKRFKPAGEGVWELKLDKPIAALPKGTLAVSVKDGQGNVTRVERTFSVANGPPPFLGLPDDRSRKVGDEHPQSALADIETMSAVREATYADYLDQKKGGRLTAEERRGRFVYFAVRQSRHVPFPNGSSAYVDVVERYKAPVPAER